ncbi:hypothetical protein V6N13_138745 [Hibiscus sabdariffa]|uniref:Uncharacterized protein n=1 Tax=Hibiscus sabdariffa TaxID=183260 RepID=A0ABR2PJP6_9ROSI
MLLAQPLASSLALLPTVPSMASETATNIRLSIEMLVSMAADVHTYPSVGVKSAGKPQAPGLIVESPSDKGLCSVYVV